MSVFANKIRPHVVRELEQASISLNRGEPALSFKHLENAHVLGQESTYFHVLTHLHMAAWAIRQKDIRELFGQILRIVGAAMMTAIGQIPIGNTGGSNISPFKSLPLREEHERIISHAKNPSSYT